MVTVKHLKPYFQGKNVVVTGHTGFKGAWLIQILQHLGANISGFALEPEHPEDLYNQIDGEQICKKSVLHNLCDAPAVQQFIISAEPDYIFHMAAQPLVLRGYKEPLYTFNVNAQGTANLLDAIRTLDKPCVCVCITTDKVYANNDSGKAFVESDALGGYDPYSASKAAAEIIIESYRSSFFNNANYDKHRKSIASVRAGNVIGGGDFADNRIIPDIVKALRSGDAIELRNPAATRPWQHVIEPLGAYLLLAAKMHDEPTKYNTAYNIGPVPADVIPVSSLVDIAIDVWGSGTWKDISTADQPHEAQALTLDITKIKHELAWQPKLAVNDAIKHTIQWYKDDAEASVKCLQLIRTYFEANINDADDH
ncbi:MAG: CDP-glucose 4,6-dehydratase [Bacteroidota bacterium]|jgi:CDP-glucose 4,6-dehydratase